jgi:hypothetical protein
VLDLPITLAGIYVMVKGLKHKITSGDIDHDDIDAILKMIREGGQHG